eukprot:gnl/TRDRNA2_/TRDRNA2_125860_c0_seq2.p1 gnl/TRDRNA2_/TRDRNA2_125860_c0~~gnl/TRDRNA2_/TRDRNA2_125860_c0_seq2.p1  ORF type:complete len:239 (-),score=17.31 gnl/TRDRNA2_/TRDRNA2_125860_c0_seq2:120-836(-)
MAELQVNECTVMKASILMRDGVAIDARIYRPALPPIAAVVYAHGGAFATGDCESNAAMSMALAHMQIAVVDTSYRQGADHPHPGALEDLADVTRYARVKLWPELPIGVAGSSSGGAYALALSREPPDEVPYAFCIALCPVAHPGRRAAYLRSCLAGTAAQDGYRLPHKPESANRILSQQLQYFQTEESMHAFGQLLMTPGKFHNSPTRTMIVLGSADKNVPQQVTAGVQDSCRRRAWA